MSGRTAAARSLKGARDGSRGRERSYNQDFFHATAIEPMAATTLRVIPPARNVSIRAGWFFFRTPSPGGRRLPTELCFPLRLFFKSLERANSLLIPFIFRHSVKNSATVIDRRYLN
jgi:hypothetical protein